ncbi:unnamed protein product [Schistosoma margrebowiei]|uniref:Uncharacterized protein n=1 Tax=Schistosoma margrebowiei TaxID=48269 RepID=A0A183LSB4_9TREM|nr:unnamed protein product [Schistosoma margrebowiei]
MEDNWKGIKDALTSTCQEVRGLKKHHYREWITTETLNKIKERKNKKTAISNSRTRAQKVQAQSEYIETNKYSTTREKFVSHSELPGANHNKTLMHALLSGKRLSTIQTDQLHENEIIYSDDNTKKNSPELSEVVHK